jgi:hypothetical protein
MKQLHLGSLAGVAVLIRPIAFFVTPLLWIIFSAIGFFALGMSLGVAILVGLIAVLLHWASEIAHHLGHAGAANRTGYPMQSIIIGGIQGYLTLSSYPANEPTLPDSIHVRRAIGGPIASLLMTILFGVFVYLIVGDLWWVALLLFIENLLFTIQLFLPMGKLLDNDGNTFYRWLRGRGKVQVSV